MEFQNKEFAQHNADAKKSNSNLSNEFGKKEKSYGNVSL